MSVNTMGKRLQSGRSFSRSLVILPIWIIYVSVVKWKNETNKRNHWINEWMGKSANVFAYSSWLFPVNCTKKWIIVEMQRMRELILKSNNTQGQLFVYLHCAVGIGFLLSSDTMIVGTVGVCLCVSVREYFRCGFCLRASALNFFEIQNTA